MARRVMEITEVAGWVQISNRPAVITISQISTVGSKIFLNDAPSETAAEIMTSFSLEQQFLQPERKLTYIKITGFDRPMRIIIDD